MNAVGYYMVYLPLWIFYNAVFWKSKDSADICAELTNISASHWAVNELTCKDLIERQFNSFMVAGLCMVYFLVLVQSVLIITKSCLLGCFSLSLSSCRGPSSSRCSSSASSRKLCSAGPVGRASPSGHERSPKNLGTD